MFSSEQIFDITCETKEQLAKILEFALAMAGTEINDFYIANDNTLVLCRSYAPSTKYPFTANPVIIAEHAQQHIDNIPYTEKSMLLGPRPNIDGSVEEGFQVFHPNYSTHQINPYENNPILAIRPAWIIYAK